MRNLIRTIFDGDLTDAGIILAAAVAILMTVALS